MTAVPPPLNTPDLADQVLALCRRAGEAILQIYNGPQGFAVELKKDDSPVTQADLAAHRVLLDGLAGLLPEVPILSEESALPDWEQRRQWRRYWLVDPLDGTKEFVSRNGEFTVNVALVEAGIPILGVVYVPVLDIAYWGGRGLAATKIVQGSPRSIAVRSVASRRSRGLPLEVVASRRHGAQAVDDLLARLARQLGPLETKNMGSSLKLCLVAEGEADLYPRLAPTAEWDTAAAQAVVEAAGGRVVDERFRDLRYNRKADLLNPFFYVLGDPDFGWQDLLVRDQAV